MSGESSFEESEQAPVGGKGRRRDNAVEEEQQSKRSQLRASPALLLASCWCTKDVTDHLRESGIPETLLQTFADNAREGERLLEETEGARDVSRMAHMEISALGHMKDIMEAVHKLKCPSDEEEKVFNDPIHGPIALHPLMVKIIDTPQFQRLHHIKQMGGKNHVFPGASHNRFEHSIGVGYLAGKLVETLRTKQKELNIDDKDVLCVKIAGLCHDLGHGPFSHVFERFIRRVQKNEWKHEEASMMMLDHLIKENQLEEEMKRYGLEERDMTFIKELIEGKYKDCEGRDRDKWFLAEIVANKRTGIDVDKWDYLARDCHGLGFTNSFDMRRYMAFVRVIPVDGIRQICAREKEVDDIYEMFHARHTLHRRACKHKTAVAIEEMLIDALVKANDHLFIPGTNVRMSEAIYDPCAFTRLTDSIVSQILAVDSTGKPQLEEAQDLLKRIEKRQLFKLVGKLQLKDKSLNASEVPEKILKHSEQNPELKDVPKPNKEHLRAVIVTLDYGMDTDNPLEKARYYKKNAPDEPIRLPTEEVSMMRPVMFLEKELRIYYTKQQPEKHEHEAAKKCFEAWRSQED